MALYAPECDQYKTRKTNEKLTISTLQKKKKKTRTHAHTKQAITTATVISCSSLLSLISMISLLLLNC